MLKVFIKLWKSSIFSLVHVTLISTPVAEAVGQTRAAQDPASPTAPQALKSLGELASAGSLLSLIA